MQISEVEIAQGLMPALVEAGHTAIPALIDQGTHDEFLAEQLFPQDLQAAYAEHGATLTLRMQEGYDHSYFFIATFIGGAFGLSRQGT